MPANVGEMFYTGDVPWHGEGLHLAKPATMEEALKAGGLNWKVEKVDLLTADDPPSPVPTRQAIVRLDRPPGDEQRVLGVAHLGFQPLQNRDGALLFEAIFGQGRPVYHTGGYLGHGEVVWLLAKIDHPVQIEPGDVIEPFALFTNSHDGSVAIHIRLTMVRVVCQNTLAFALKEREFGKQFARAHQGSFRQHADAARAFFAESLRQVDATAGSFTRLTTKACSRDHFMAILEALLPMPTKLRDPHRSARVLSAYEARVQGVVAAREKIEWLRQNGKGMDLPGSRGTFWGVLNAVLEFVDHHKVVKGSKLAYALLGDGMDLKTRAFRLIQDEANAA